MEKLTTKEEEIMHILWRIEKAFVKDVLAEIKTKKTTLQYLIYYD